MRNVPPHVKAVMEALKFGGTRREGLRTMTDSEWKDILSHWGFVRLTLPLRQVCGDDLPTWVREQIDRYITDNTERFSRIRRDYLEIANALREAGVEHLVLKGFAQWPAYMQSPRFRAQSDIDLFCPSESVFRTRDALCTLGYQHIGRHERQVEASDHVFDMMRKTDWQWRGRHFDPESPISIDLHSGFWNKPLLRLDPAGLEQFWPRRIERQLEDFSFPALNAVDNLGYCTLHLLRHLLLAEVLPYHVYELSWFLHANADNERFWKEWRELHHHSLRSLEAVCFRLARDWFACRLAPEAESEIESLPTTVQQWFKDYGNSPLADLIQPNRDGLWLHLSLLESSSDKRSVFCRRLFPTPITSAKAAMHWPLRTYPKFFLQVVSRVRYHLRLLPPTLWRGFRWWWSAKGLDLYEKQRSIPKRTVRRVSKR